MKKRSTILVNNLIILFFFVLNYIFVLNKYYNYGVMTFELNFSFIKILIASFLLISVYILGSIIRNEFSYCIWNIIYVYMFIPTIIYFVFNNSSSKPVFSLVILLVLLYFLSNIKILDLKHANYKGSSKFSVSFLVIVSILLFIPFVIIYRNSLNLNNLLFQDIYETRSLMTSLSNPLVDYFESPLVRVIIPILFIKSIEKKNYLLLAYSIIVIIYIFLCGALKSNLFIVALITIFYFGNTYQKKLIIFLRGVKWVSILSLIEYYIFNQFNIVDLFIRRVFFIPPMLNDTFYNYFSVDHMYWSYTRIGSLINPNSEIGRSVTQYIGTKIMGGDNLNANVGIITEGYISAGIFGVVLICIFICLIVIFLKSIDLEPKYFGILLFNIYLINTSFLETALITHGLFYFLIAAPFFMRKVQDHSIKLLEKG